MNLRFSFLVALVTLLLGFTLVSAWTGPTGTAPANNVSAPISVGSVNQTKNANLGVNGLAVFGNTLLGGIAGSNAYLNFGATAGTTGYGFRDNAGVMEFKNSAGAWSGISTGLADAPSNGTIYGRQNAAWVAVPNGGISDAPSNGSLYARKNAAWVVVPSGGTVTGSGTTNYHPKWTSATALGNSIISDNGSTATVAGSLVASGAAIGVQGTNTGNNNWGGYFTGGYGVYAQDSSGIYGELGNGGWSFYGNGNSYTGGYANIGGYLTVASNNAGDAIYASTGNIHTHGSFQADGVSGAYGVASYGSGGIYAQGPIVTDASAWAVNITTGALLINGNYGGYSLEAITGNGYFAGPVYAASYPGPSDIRLKKDIQPLSDNLAKVLQLQPVSFLWKDPTYRGSGKQIGFIAQQVEPIVPEVVFTETVTTMKAIDYSKLTPLLVGSVQELNQKIEDQQKQLDAQQQQIDALSKELQTLQAK